jgi:hypothetical protein
MDDFLKYINKQLCGEESVKLSLRRMQDDWCFNIKELFYQWSLLPHHIELSETSEYIEISNVEIFPQ